MKICHFLALALLLPCVDVPAQDRLYRCGNEYTNSVSEAQAKNCKLVWDSEPDLATSGGEPDPEKWVEIERTSNGNVYYVSKSPMQKEGNLIKGWSLTNYKKYQFLKGGARYLSSMSLDVFKCNASSIGTRQYVTYSLHSGNGDVVKRSSLAPSEVEWSEVVPDSIGESLLEHACGKKKSGR